MLNLILELHENLPSITTTFKLQEAVLPDGSTNV